MRARTLALLALLPALVVVGAVWLLRDDAPGGGPVPSVRRDGVGPAGTTLPTGDGRLPDVGTGAPAPLTVDGGEPPVVTIRTAFDGRRLTWSGRIVDPDGRPLPGADVWLVTPYRLLAGWPAPDGLRTGTFFGERRGVTTADVRNGLDLDEQEHARTDDDGRFTIGAEERARASTDPVWNRGPVWWTLVVAAPSHATRTIELPFEARDLITMPDIALEPEALVRGVVRDADGLPVSDAFVCPRFAVYQPLRLAGAAGVSRVCFERLSGTRTDRDGAFALHGLWAGELSLIVEHPAHPPLARSGIRLVAGEVEELELTLLRSAALSGTVVDADGAPVSGASVVATAAGASDESAWRAAQEAAAQRLPVARTDDDGRFLLANAADRVNDVLAWAAGHEPSRLSDVPAGAGALRLRLEPERELLVRCVDEATGRLLPDAEVTARRGGDQSAGLSVEAVDGTDSTHRVRGVGVVESTVVRATHPGYRRASRTLDGGDVDGTMLELSLAPGAVVVGEVRSTDGRRVAGARVEAREQGGDRPSASVERATSDESGRFGLTGLGPGEWALCAEADGFATGPRRSLTVAVGDRVEDVVVTLVPEAVVSGRVLDGDTAPPWRESLRLEALDEPVWSTDRPTDHDGRFHFGGLLAGRYRLSAPALGLPDTAVEFTLATGEARELTLALPARPVVHGRVRGADAGVVVHAYPVDTISRRPPAVATDDDGAFRLYLPGPGTWAVTADRAGTPGRIDPPMNAREVTVAWDEERALDLELPGL